jgi:hypothetical protein
VNLITELWHRAISTQPVPTPQVSAILAVVALAAVVLAWRVVRTLVTICHEGGHALVAVVVGRRLTGIRVHSDTSGLTLSRGRPTGPGMVATLLAGYTGPAIVGLGLAALAGTGHAAGVLWLLVLLAALMLLWIRNLYGLFVVLVAGAAVALASWYSPPTVLGWIATGLAWLFLLAAPRPVLELFRSRSTASDAAQLAALTRIHRYGWCLLWLALTLAALATGALWMVPGLYRAVLSLA